MNFDDFQTIEFEPRTSEPTGFVYVLFWIEGTSAPVPFYVGQTRRIWGRMDDYYWAMFSACTDFRVGEAAKHLRAKGLRVILKFRKSIHPREEEKELISALDTPKRRLLNSLPAYNYRTSIDIDEGSRVRAFIDQHYIGEIPK